MNTLVENMSNVWVSGVKLSSFLTQREDDSNQQERKKLSERHPTLNDFAESSERTCAGLFFLRSWAKIWVQFQKSLSTTLHIFGCDNFKVSHLKLRHFTSHETMFCASAFMSHRWYRKWPVTINTLGGERNSENTIEWLRSGQELTPYCSSPTIKPWHLP